MNKNLPKSEKILIGFISVGLLTACGGGGGSSNDSSDTSIRFNGVTTQAQISQSNASDFAEDSVNKSTASASSTTALGGIGSSAQSPLSSQTTSTLLQKITATTSMSKADTQACSGGGTITFDIDANESTGDFSGDAQLNNCIENDQTSNGSLSFSGSIDVNLLELDAPLRFSFNNLNTSTADGTDITINGTLQCDFTNISVEFSCIENFDLQDNISGEIFRAENIEVAISTAGFDDSVNISGRFFHPDHGYVDIVTDTSLTIANGDIWPSSGVIRLLGSNNSIARITAIDNTQYMLEVDADGDSVFESNTLEDWPS